MADRGVVLDLIVTAIQVRDTQWVTTLVESIQNIDSGATGECVPVIVGLLVFKAGFIHGFPAQYLRVTDLDRMLGECGVVPVTRQRQLANPGVLLRVMYVLIARRESVVCGKLVINPRALRFVRMCGLGTMVAKSCPGKSLTTLWLIRPTSLILRRSMVNKKDDFLLRGPPKLLLYICY